MAAVAAKKAEFDALGVQVLSVSTDSMFVHKMWNDEELSKMVDGGVQFPMLSDNGEIGRKYGVFKESEGVDMRGRFIIDPDGVIQAMEVLTPPVGRRVDEALRQIQAFQHVRNSNYTEVTPAGWTPGKPTLKPNPELVGKIWKEWKLS
ncbi:peroxiredoxin (alkyl hydroperoxide reductase subunit C) [Tepidibacillus fermentans]|uniref:Peroxiredoxin (Alkyl hydroperoxide reductase subunit C) n=1 Tax=Tepidibacillus fermentans TaxID=1281767 RepID=A0A4R3KI84_9BACI|nr:peroxiredoxin (alkyl hydroperoxide reductase subunit C) [Tepidibacillus fermentans]